MGVIILNQYFVERFDKLGDLARKASENLFVIPLNDQSKEYPCLLHLYAMQILFKNKLNSYPSYSL